MRPEQAAAPGLRESLLPRCDRRVRLQSDRAPFEVGRVEIFHVADRLIIVPERGESRDLPRKVESKEGKTQADDGDLTGQLTSSMAIAVASPPPMHADATPFDNLRFCSA